MRRGVGRTCHIVLSVLPVHRMFNLSDLSTMHSAACLKSLPYLRGFVNGSSEQAVGDEEYDEKNLRVNARSRLRQCSELRNRTTQG